MRDSERQLSFPIEFHRLASLHGKRECALEMCFLVLFFPSAKYKKCQKNALFFPRYTE